MIPEALERSNRTPEPSAPRIDFQEEKRDIVGAAPTTGPIDGRRLAGAPISWGVCEVPGWGRMLSPDRVLAEMASLGLTATELGPLGYLATDPAAIKAKLSEHGLRLVGGFVPLVLHNHALDAHAAHQAAEMLAKAGADTFVAAAVADPDWSAPQPLDDHEWGWLAANLHGLEDVAAQHGLTLALHPHVGTQIETSADVERTAATTTVPWCLDTGHLLIGGTDPTDFARRYAGRIAHVHLKDVDARVAARLRAGELTLVAATQQGLFRPLGHGDAQIDRVIEQLDESGYERWLVLEQDTAITGEEPPVGRGPVLDVRTSIEYLHTLAPVRRERGL